MMTFGQAMKLGAAATKASFSSYLHKDRACAIGAALYAAGYRYEDNDGFKQLQKDECVRFIHKEWPYTIDAKIEGSSLVAVAEHKFMRSGKSMSSNDGYALSIDGVAEWVMQWERDHGILVDEPQPAVVEEEVTV